MQLADYIRQCEVCAQKWQSLAADFFDLKSRTYLLVIDYYSCFIELALMSSMTTSQTILHLRSILARHGYPDELVTDNGTQFSSCEFANFAKTINMKRTTSSPLFPQLNGLAECSVKTVKHLLHSSPDSYEALLAYRATPLDNGYSPAQLLFGQQVRTNVPITLQQRCPSSPDSSKLAQADKHLKQRQK